MLMLIRDIIAAIFVAGGVFFFLVSVIGLIRLPDIYMRVHATAREHTWPGPITFGGHDPHGFFIYQPEAPADYHLHLDYKSHSSPSDWKIRLPYRCSSCLRQHTC